MITYTPTHKGYTQPPPTIHTVLHHSVPLLASHTFHSIAKTTLNTTDTRRQRIHSRRPAPLPTDEGLFLSVLPFCPKRNVLQREPKSRRRWRRRRRWEQQLIQQQLSSRSIQQQLKQQQQQHSCGIFIIPSTTPLRIVLPSPATTAAASTAVAKTHLWLQHKLEFKLPVPVPQLLAASISTLPVTAHLQQPLLAIWVRLQPPHIPLWLSAHEWRCGRQCRPRRRGTCQRFKRRRGRQPQPQSPVALVQQLE